MAETTYYKYQERDQQAQINWAEVGKNFSDTLKNEAELREKKKAAIDEATREFQKNLNETPQGESTSINEWALKYGEQAQQQMLMQEKLLKSGMLKPSDYTLMRQNLVDGTDEAFDLVQSYQDEYSRKMERYMSEDPSKASQGLEEWLMEQVEGFGDFNKSELVVNPETGKVSVAFKRMNANGVMELDTNPNNLRSVSSLKNNIRSDFDKYQLEKSTASFVETQGNWQTVIRSVGSSQRKGLIKVLSNPMAKNMTKDELMEQGLSSELAETANYYFDSEQDWITAQMSNIYNVTSMLTDYVGKDEKGNEYTFTYDPNEFNANNPNLILLENDAQGRPVPKFTEEQEEVVREKITTAIRSKLDKSVTTQVVPDYNPPSVSSLKMSEAKKQQETVVGFWSKLYDAENTAQTQSAIEGILGSDLAKDQGMLGIEFSDNGDEVSFTYTNSAKNRTVSIGEDPSTEDWIKLGTEIYGDYDIRKATSAAGNFGEDATYNPEYVKNIYATRQGKTEKAEPLSQAINIITSAIPSDLFFDKDDEYVQSDIESQLSLMGLSVENKEILSNSLTITNPVNNASIKILTNEDKAGSKVQKKRLDDFIRGQMTEANAERILKLGTGSGAADNL